MIVLVFRHSSRDRLRESESEIFQRHFRSGSTQSAEHLQGAILATHWPRRKGVQVSRIFCAALTICLSDFLVYGTVEIKTVSPPFVLLIHLLYSGCCYRLYSEEEYCRMSESTVPEILRCNLAAVLLQIMAMGIKDVHKFDFMNKPGPGEFQ